MVIILYNNYMCNNNYYGHSFCNYRILCFYHQLKSMILIQKILRYLYLYVCTVLLQWHYSVESTKSYQYGKAHNNTYDLGIAGATSLF